ncbi:MAG: methyltransferase domain-containing protein [Rhodocyclales bacterium]|nr:methyltransferase domain-containing protein [Rhodocyclales bacterium]
MKDHKSRIAARFGAAANDYDAHSPLQRTAAQRLAQRVKRLTLPAAPRVLEIGCGTGHLTRELLPALGGEWFVSDIAPAMLAACRREFGPALRYLAMDGERPATAAASFDLIVSSLTAQWFADLPRALPALTDLLAPGGCLALATLGKNTFAEWRAAHAAAGLRAATPDYPDAQTLALAFPAGMAVAVDEEDFAEPLTDALDFMRGLRRIGADTPAPGSRPLTPGRMRQVLRSFAAGGQTRYHLLYAIAFRSSSTSQPRTTR